MKPLNAILIKPAGADCNLQCSYCFYLDKKELYLPKKSHRMSEKTLETMIKKMMSGGDREISFAWQGGEPTLMGLPFYQKAVDLQQIYGKGQTVGNSLQTNGLLINDRWIKFLKKYNFLVGLSLDGPEHVHDHYRRDTRGNGSWKKVDRIAKKLLEEGVAVNALSTVTDYSAGFIDETYAYLKRLGFEYLQFIPVLERDSDQAAPFSVKPEPYGTFLCRLFDRWHDDFTEGKAPSIRFFEAVFFSYVGKQPPMCTLLEECGNYLVAEHNGDIYTCDFYVAELWKLGNIQSDSLKNLLNSQKQNKFGRRKSALPSECARCNWKRYCRGGCPKDRENNPATNGSNHFCQSYKMFFQHANKRLKQLADDWKTNHP